MESTICYIYVLFWIIWKSRVSLSIVPDPCPKIQPSTQVTDMCKAGSAVEQIGESNYGSDNFDHVTLRARTQEDNCTCLVFIENQSTTSFQMYIKPYNLFQSSAPKESECGLELFLDFYQKETLKQDKITNHIRCTSGQASRSLSFYKKSVLRFTSKVINGNFTRGYCIDIQRVHVNGENGTLKMVCGVPDVIPSLNLTTQSTDHPTDHPSFGSSSSSKKDVSTIYIAIGGSAGGLLIVIVVLVIIFYRRKLSAKSIKKPEPSEPDTTPTNEHDNPDYNGLKYNMLYVSADHQDVLEGDYHTVNNDQPQINKKVSENDINYSTVDDIACTSFNTVSAHEVVTNSHKGLRYENVDGKEISKRDHKISQEGNGDTYAVVDKKRITGHNNNKKTPVYAVVDKTGKLNMENEQS